jgi:hypothetical protein
MGEQAFTLILNPIEVVENFCRVAQEDNRILTQEYDEQL